MINEGCGYTSPIPVPSSDSGTESVSGATEADSAAEVLAVGVASEVEVGVVSVAAATSKVGVSLETTDPTHRGIIHVHK